MKYKKEIISILFIGMLGVVSTFLIFCKECMFNWGVAWRSALATTIFWIVLWKGNEYISHLLDKKYPWLASPNRRFILGISASVIFTTVAIIVMISGMEILLGWEMGENKARTILTANGIAIFIFCFLVARQFMFAWRDLALREEKIKTELMTSKFESLKNQINPHFMFNSLNALSSLIYEDQKMAEKYIDQLSKVLRYVLDAGKKELVPLADELEILESYIFLQKIRYAENIEVDIAIESENRNQYVPPLVLQLLIENAIKHNEISSEHPLTIDVIEESGYIKVKNAIRPKEVLRKDSTALGLKNIKARYNLLSDRQVIVHSGNGLFSVELPLIEAPI